MRLPPFGGRLNSEGGDIWVYFGSDPWLAAKYRAARKLPVLVLPPDQKPESFRWPVAGREILMIQQGRHDILRIPSFANLLFSYGAAAVRCIYGEGRFVSYQGKLNDKAS